jgi:hypothetical protein
VNLAIAAFPGLIKHQNGNICAKMAVKIVLIEDQFAYFARFYLNGAPVNHLEVDSIIPAGVSVLIYG